MKIEAVFFDMDGVLADFDGGVRTLAGMEPLPQNDSRPEDYDDRLWEHVRRVAHFYDRLEPMPGAVELFRKVYEKYGDRCGILTGVPKPRRGIVTAAEDKVAWVRRLLSEDVTVHTVHREDKKLYCKGPGWILIDDYEKNIREWTEIGGTGILFLDAAGTLEALKRLEDA